MAAPFPSSSRSLPKQIYSWGRRCLCTCSTPNGPRTCQRSSPRAAPRILLVQPSEARINGSTNTYPMGWIGRSYDSFTPLSRQQLVETHDLTVQNQAGNIGFKIVQYRRILCQEFGEMVGRRCDKSVPEVGEHPRPNRFCRESVMGRPKIYDTNCGIYNVCERRISRCLDQQLPEGDRQHCPLMHSVPQASGHNYSHA